MTLSSSQAVSIVELPVGPSTAIRAYARPMPIEAVMGVLFGAALTLCMQGYQFGKSNHTVYLIDALRHVHPELLNNDWFAIRTGRFAGSRRKFLRPGTRTGKSWLRITRPRFA